MLKTITGGLKCLDKLCSLKKINTKPLYLQQSTAATSGLGLPTSDDEDKLQSLRNNYPDFLPNPDLKLRNQVREMLERNDMLSRRKVIDIPPFYVGSVVAVTSSDMHSPGKTIRFLGICIYRGDYGLRTKFILRNVIENEGVEIMYYLYSPTIQKIEVLKLEKRLDDELFYLRDAPQEYSTFPFDMEQQYIDRTAEVPVNDLKVPLNERPWEFRYERMNLKGAILPQLSEKILMKAKQHEKPWEQYDLMDIYRKQTPEEDQKEILDEISERLKELESKVEQRKQKKEADVVVKKKLF